MKDSTPIGLQSQINKLVKKIRRQVSYNTGPLTGPVGCCYILGIDSTTGDLFYRDIDSNWQSIPSVGGSGWSLTGNSGTIPDINFLGTTDDVGLMFKTNNIQSGYIDLLSTNTSFGYQSLTDNTSAVGTGNVAFGTRGLQSNTVGGGNTAIGANSLKDNIDGSSNTAIGSSAMQMNISGVSNTGVGIGNMQQSTGSFNSSVGESGLLLNTGNYNSTLGKDAMFNNDNGSNNIAIGYRAGYYNTTESNQIFISSLDRVNYIGDLTKSPIYIQQNIDPLLQITTFNSKVKVNDGTQSDGYIFTSDSDGLGHWQAPSPGAATLIATQIAFGDGSNLMTSSGNLTFDGTTFISEVNGSITPQSGGTFDLVSSPGDKIRINRSGGGVKIGDVDGNGNGNVTTFDDNQNSIFYDNSAHNGLFGINTSTPSVALDIVGDIHTGGSVYPSFFKADQSTGLFGIGDFNLASNGTFISGDDMVANLITYRAASGHIFSGGGISIGTDAVPLGAFESVGDIFMHTVAYPDGLFMLNNAGFWSMGDYGGGLNGTSISGDDGGSTINMVANNGYTLGGGSVTISNISGTGTRGVTASSSGVLGTTVGTLTSVVASADLVNQTTANSSIVNYTPSTNGTFRVGSYINVTAISAATITLKVTYTNENNVAVTQVIPVTLAATGAIGTATTIISNNSGMDIQIRASSGNPITILTTLTGASATYDVGATIEKLR